MVTGAPISERLRGGRTDPGPGAPAFTEAGGHPVGARAFDQAGLLPAHLLDGDEIVILAIKPSLWFVVFVSARWVTAMIMVTVLAGWLSAQIPPLRAELIVRGAVALAGARLGLAMLQWVSHLYVLTNRRVLRLRGIFNVDLFECQLTRIQHTYVTLAWYERLVGAGTISFSTAGSAAAEADWRHVARPLEVHERVRSAVLRSQRPGLNGV